VTRDRDGTGGRSLTDGPSPLRLAAICFILLVIQNFGEM
jgi:hypothetical protein